MSRSVTFKKISCIMKILLFAGVLLLMQWLVYSKAFALNTIPSVRVDVGASDSPQEVASTVQLIFMITIIALAPTLILMVTSFTRIIISLHFLRSAMGTQQMPPNQILIGIALFLTLFMMGPVLTQINDNALKPYSAGTLAQDDAIKEGMKPLREFMFNQVGIKEMDFFISLSGAEYATNDDIPDRVLIPAFILNELKQGFTIGFMIYLPFIVIDMVVASTLMAMGMMMLPPAMIALPFKIMLFLLVDGWTLVLRSVLKSFKF